jgi:catechol 2,3-dioxygenase-like lactoylglutathione lyase family enzyme
MALAYVTIGSNDTTQARSYYNAVLSVLGGVIAKDFMPQGFMYRLRDGGRIEVRQPNDGWTASPGNGNVLGLACHSEADVQKAYVTALASGATSDGSPGKRPEYGADFYAAYVRDPEGNRMSFVYLGPSAA